MLTAIAVATALCVQGAPSVDAVYGRDAILAEAPPYPFNRTDSVSREGNGRLWVSRTPIGTRTPIRERAYAQPGAAAYGAAADEIGRTVYARILHQRIAIDPWERIEGRGALGTLETARNRWLREHGYVLKVRTHVNTALREAGDGDGEIRPRATIEVDRDVIRPVRQHVEAGRVSIPWWAETDSAIVVVEPEPAHAPEDGVEVASR